MKKLYCIGFLFCIGGLAVAQTADKAAFDAGVRLKKEKKCLQAVDSFKRALQYNPSFTDARYEMAWCQNELKDYAGAVGNLKQVRTAWPDYAKVYFELGYAFEQLGRLDSAVAQYNKCLQINPNYVSVYKRLAGLAYNKEDYTQALQHYQKAVDVSTEEINDYLFWYRKGFCENNGKEYEKALLSFQKAQAQNKRYASTYLEIGYAHAKLKHNDSAIAAYQKAIELEPKNHVGYNGIAEVYRDNQKDYEKAMSWYQQTLSLNPKERKANYGMGYCLNSQSKSLQAIPYLKQALQSEPSYTAAMTELGYAYYKTGSNEEALAVLKNAISLNAQSQNAYYYLTLTYIALKDKVNAQKQVDALRAIGSVKYAEQLQPKVNEMP